MRAASPPDLRPGGAAVGAGAHLRAAHRRDRRVAFLRRPQCHAAQGVRHRGVLGRRLLREPGARIAGAVGQAPRHLQTRGDRGQPGLRRGVVRRHARGRAAQGADRRAGATSGRFATSCCSTRRRRRRRELDTGAPTRTTCPYCGVGCGVLATRRKDVVEVRGDPAHPGESRQAVRRRAARWARPWVSKTACCIRRCAASACPGPTPSARSRANSAAASSATARTRWRSTCRASCSPRTTTSPTS